MEWAHPTWQTALDTGTKQLNHDPRVAPMWSARPARIGILIPLLAALILAGCVDDTALAPAPGTDQPAPCPLLPDGSRMDCTTSILQDVEVRASAPSILDGWACTIDHDDDAPESYYRLFSHQDGRLAWQWKESLPSGEHRYMSMGLFEPDRTQWVFFPFTEEGFAEMPEPRQGSVGEFEIRSYWFGLDYWQDGTWHPAEDATLAMGLYNDTGYFVWQWESPWGFVEIDMNVPEGGAFDADYRPTETLVEIADGVIASAAVIASTVDFAGQYWDWTRVVGTDCTAESLPEVGA